jgi:hypothetical protein
MTRCSSEIDEWGLEKHMKTGKKQNSTNSTKGGRHGKWLMLAALTLMLGLVAPFAVAGPEQDNEQAIKEFNRGDLVARPPTRVTRRRKSGLAMSSINPRRIKKLSSGSARPLHRAMPPGNLDWGRCTPKAKA